MSNRRERHLSGLDYLAAVTELLQRCRDAHATAGLFEAADLQWWWRSSRVTDEVAQLFWFDDDGRPVAAVIATAWSDATALDAMILPDMSPERHAQIMERGLEHFDACGFGAIRMEIDPAHESVAAVLLAHGFEVDGEGLFESWLAAVNRPLVSPLPDGYRLATRACTSDRPHHMISEARGHADPEPRLHQTSLYRPDLDLVVFDGDDQVAAYGLFWYDPATGTGLVEPMRTEDEHQRRGLARHVLTAGVDLLASAGAEQIKICFEPDNPAAKHLYLSVGFEPVRQTVMYSRSAT